MKRTFLQKKFNAWLDRRIQPAQKIVLTRKNTYILPTRQGLIFLALFAGLFFGGVNYANSLVLSLTFLMISLFMVSMLYTYRNLTGLIIEAVRAENAFVGESALFTIMLTRAGRRCYESLELIWDGALPQRVNLLQEESVPATLLLPLKKRGYFKPGRLKIETRYPVGLFRAWSWVQLDMGCWVYPRPIQAPAIFNSTVSGDGHLMTHASGLDDFAGLRLYVPGDSLKQVDWKTLARTQDLYTKLFIQAVDQDVWLDWQQYPHLTTEARLSALCADLLYYIKQQQSFGLKMPGFEKKPDLGFIHQQLCLEALARYQHG